MLVKSFITLDLESPFEWILENIYREILSEFCSSCDLEFVDNLHITLDNIWLKELRMAVLKLERLIIKRSELKSAWAIKIWGINSFISNTNWRRIFFLEIEWSESFFECIKECWCSLNIPHITLFEMDNNLSNEEIEGMLIRLNNNPILKNLINQLIVNNSIIYLKCRTKDRTLKTVWALRLK